ncbi:MAG: SGNH/GDSL hydrolase family protein [Candidatus Binatia bacterium]
MGRWSGFVGAIGIGLALVGCRPGPPPRILCLGDSITLGTTRGGERDGVDPQGGYAGRLGRLLDGRAEVRCRAAGGATAAMWLASSDSPRGRVLAATLGKVGPPLPPAASPQARVVDTVLDADRPDVVVVLLGTNDLALSRDQPEDVAVEEVLGQLHAVRAAIIAHGARPLVATVLPSGRPTAPRAAALNARLRAEMPEVVDLAADFEAAGGVRLLGDDVHPNAAGHEVLAGLVADTLVRRGFVAAR